LVADLRTAFQVAGAVRVRAAGARKGDELLGTKLRRRSDRRTLAALFLIEAARSAARVQTAGPFRSTISGLGALQLIFFGRASRSVDRHVGTERRLGDAFGRPLLERTARSAIAALDGSIAGWLLRVFRLVIEVRAVECEKYDLRIASVHANED